ncbi:hypothetical protein [Clostridium butyricum]
MELDIVDVNLNARSNNNYKIFTVIYISLFIFSQEFRSILGGELFIINPIAIICVALLIVNNMTVKLLRNLDKLFGVMLVYMISASTYEPQLSTILNTICTTFIPIILILVQIEEETLVKIFEKLIRIINVLMILITIIGILECIFGININIYFSGFMSARTGGQIMSNVGSQRRMYSFMGHPLFNTELYLIFFVLNIIYDRYILKTNDRLWIVCVATIGICLTSSKSGLILLGVAIVLLYRCNSKFKKFVYIFCGMFIILKLGLLDNVLIRFGEESLTSGRNETWDKIQMMGLYPIKFFSGYGKDSTFNLNNITSFWASAAFEYPFRAYEFECGILITILIYIYILILPIIKLIKYKQKELLIGFLIIFIDVNTFNGLIASGDKFYIFCLFIFIILNIGELKYRTCNKLKI